MKNAAESKDTIVLWEPPSNNYAKKRQRRRNRRAKLRRKKVEEAAHGFEYTIVPGQPQLRVPMYREFLPMRVTDEDDGSARLKLVTSICFCCICVVLVVMLVLARR